MIYKNIELPNDLKPLTEKFVKDIIDNFDENNKLNSLDTLSLYLLANNIDTFLECEEQIRTSGYTMVSDRGNTSLSNYVVLQKSIQASITVLLKELGLTLGSRNKLKVVETMTEESPLAQFMKSTK